MGARHLIACHVCEHACLSLDVYTFDGQLVQKCPPRLSPVRGQEHYSGLLDSHLVQDEVHFAPQGVSPQGLLDGELAPIEAEGVLRPLVAEQLFRVLCC